jgi:hypothetical protein
MFQEYSAELPERDRMAEFGYKVEYPKPVQNCCRNGLVRRIQQRSDLEA